MFEWLIPLLVVIALLIWILDYLDMLEVATGLVALIVAAIVGIAKLTARLVRYFAGLSKPQSGAPSPDAALLKSPPPSPETGFQANRARGAGSRKRP